MLKEIGVFAMVVSVAVSARAAEPIGSAVSCGRTGSAGGLAAGVDMKRFTVDTRRFPDAICNDGTPAVFYYGPASRPEDGAKWIIFLQGGGSCRDGQSCAQRWCSIDTNFGMDKMSTSLTKETIRAGGFLDPAARNEFGSWNRVLIYYCSSDQWSGTKTSTLQAVTGSGAAVEFEMPFRGSQIIDAVLATLRYEPAMRRRSVGRDEDSATGGAAWPDLDTATDVLFAGSSGGGNGVRNNLDRVGAKLRSTNPGLRDFRGVIDAIYGTQLEFADFTRTTLCAADPIGCRYDTFFQSKRAADVEIYGARTDQSCLQYHAEVVPGTEWRCADGEHALLHHLETPFFLRHDLIDPLLAENFVETGFGTLSEYAMRVEAEVRALPVPEEPRGATPGQFHPQCGDHEAFTNNRDVFDVRVDGSSFYDIVSNWWSGAQPQIAIRAFTGSPAPAPECP